MNDQKAQNFFLKRMMEDGDDHSNDSSSSSSSSSELTEDASSNGPLFQLSDLMTHLPIKRGLSMFYEGKAQSFKSLARVESIEDLPKKLGTSISYRKRIMKSCKSFGLDTHRILCSPKATISKKTTSRVSKRGPSSIALQHKNFC